MTDSDSNKKADKGPILSKMKKVAGAAAILGVGYLASKLRSPLCGKKVQCVTDTPPLKKGEIYTIESDGYDLEYPYGRSSGAVKGQPYYYLAEFNEKKFNPATGEYSVPKFYSYCFKLLDKDDGEAKNNMDK